jgi:tetratricopeptide (TPR) repeat protein
MPVPRSPAVVLDGLEPLQEPPHDLDPGGKLRDSNLTMFLRELSRDMKGLCLITSRLAVKDLAAQARDAAPVLALARLSTPDGAMFLRDLDVHGSEAELRAAVDEQDGHALALMLLGNYLREVHDGDVGRRHGVSMLSAAEAVDSGKLERIMSAYDAWLAPRPRAVMGLVGLFDRPADEAALAALRRAPAIPGLTEALVDARDDEWRMALRPLREAGLLAPKSPQQPGALDAHPLVRAYFGETLRREQAEAWRSAHARLYEHYLASAPKVPTNLSDLGRLVDVTIHGCHAGRQAEVYREVYRGRVHAVDGYKLVTRLGAFGLELSALAAFMDRCWDRPSDALEPGAPADVLEIAAYDLRALGRLTEALVPAQIALTLDQKNGKWDPASVDASLLAEIELLLGRLCEAESHARTAVDLAERGNEPFARRIMTRTLLGEVLQCAGNFEESLALFDETERLPGRMSAGKAHAQPVAATPIHTSCARAAAMTCCHVPCSHVPGCVASSTMASVPRSISPRSRTWPSAAACACSRATRTSSARASRSRAVKPGPRARTPRPRAPSSPRLAITAAIASWPRSTPRFPGRADCDTQRALIEATIAGRMSRRRHFG